MTHAHTQTHLQTEQVFLCNNKPYELLESCMILNVGDITGRVTAERGEILETRCKFVCVFMIGVLPGKTFGLLLPCCQTTFVRHREQTCPSSLSSPIIHFSLPSVITQSDNGRNTQIHTHSSAISIRRRLDIKDNYILSRHFLRSYYIPSAFSCPSLYIHSNLVPRTKLLSQKSIKSSSPPPVIILIGSTLNFATVYFQVECNAEGIMCYFHR